MLEEMVGISLDRITNQSGTGNVVATRAEGTRIRNQARCYKCRGLGHISRNCTARPRRRDDAYLHTQLLIAHKEEAGIQLQAEEFDFIVATYDLNEIEEALVYDTDGLAKVHLNDNCYDNEIFNMFTQEGQYTDLLEPIPEPQRVPQNDNHVTSVAPSMVHSGGIVEKSFAPNEETRAHQETVYRNLVDQKMALGYPNLSNLKKAQLKQQSLYNGNLLLEEYNPPAVYDSEETLKLVQESREKMRFLKKEIKPANYAKINHLSRVKRLQAQLRDFKGKSNDTPSASNTLDPLNQKLESKIVELEFQLVNYEREISHLKTTYKNLFDSIKSNRAHAKIHGLIYENAQLRAQGFKNTFGSMKNTSGTSVTPHVDKPKLSVVTPLFKKLHASTSSHSVPQPIEFNVGKHRNVIAPRLFNNNPSQMPRVDLVPNKQSSASIRTNPITKSLRHVIVKENVSFNRATASSIGLVHTARTRRPQPKGNTRNARVLSASKSSEVKKNVTIEEHRKTLLLSKNQKTMSSKCNNIKLAIQNDKSKIICANCKQCLVTSNHDACLASSVNALNSRANKLCANVPLNANQKRHRTQVWKPKQLGS
nr:hypothetical protein [Tanacetum cinerariifolium]